MVVIFGSLLVILALYFWRFGNTPTARVLVIPFLIVGLFWKIAAGICIFRNTARIQGCRAEYDKAPVGFVVILSPPHIMVVAFSRILSAIAYASLGLLVNGRLTTNSSPPKRQQISESLTCSVRVLASSTSIRSPS